MDEKQSIARRPEVAIPRWMDGITAREKQSFRKHHPINWDDLYSLYVTQSLSMKAIGTLKQCTEGSVFSALKSRGIQRRTAHEGQSLYFRSHRETRCPAWKGGRIRQNGYISLYRPDHPYARSSRYVFEHRLVMEAKLGRYLLPGEHVHHLNGQRDDNREENLLLLSPGEHTLKEMACFKCPLKKEIRLLRWEIKELRDAVQLRLGVSDGKKP